MDTIKFKKNNTLIVAHRGLSGIETENTNAAFVAAGNRSYYAIETDIHKTADGRFVVVHDEDLLRVAGEEISVEASTLSQLQDVVLFDKDGSKDRADLRPCTLENYISICKKYGKHCVLELKAVFTLEDTEKFIDIIKEQEYLDQVTFISFHYEDLVNVRKILPEHPVQFLFTKFSDEIIENVLADKMDIDVYYRSLTKEIIDDLHNKGLKINCWTVDKIEFAEQLAEWGIDYITTNILE